MHHGASAPRERETNPQKQPANVGMHHGASATAKEKPIRKTDQRKEQAPRGVPRRLKAAPNPGLLAIRGIVNIIMIFPEGIN